MYDALAKKSNSSMKYESLVQGPALSYLHDVIVFVSESLDSAEDGQETLASLHQRFHELMNSVHGVYSLLCNRWTMLELRAQLELDPTSSHRGGAEALRAKLQFVEDRVYQASDGVVADEVLQQWLNDFDKSRVKAMLSTTAKQAANAETHTGRWKHRDDRHKKNDDKRDDKKPTGGKGEVMQWIAEGCKLRWRRGPPPAFDHGVSLRDATLNQQNWLDAEKKRLLANGENLACSMVGPGVVVPFTGDEQVERTQDLETTDAGKGAHRLIDDGMGRCTEPQAGSERPWSPPDLHDIELQARYIRSEANVWADGLSRLQDLDDWRLNRDWFEWANAQWGPYTVDRFASEISTQLPWYYAAWRDPRCEGVDSLTYDWRGENNWVNPPWALLDEVAHKLREEGAAATVVAPYWPAEVTVGTRLEVFWVDDDKFYPGVVKGFNEDGTVHVVYDDGDEENLNLSDEKFNIVRSAGVSEQNDETAEVLNENTDCGGDYEENKRGGDTQNFFVRSLCGRWKSELGMVFILRRTRDTSK
ncbi:hypothetical protein CYMTET_4483 [Cymbomonas tetramitiformis]|uniref:Tudor domain-containing protein n=1 Tax=Cymbomonas tetramitiformis TaxID=36881 RepID=A0AAE0H192_9CHLO|nr:hypothetical protein CYMTET_4483 [Cymbomonas tetramitiformis]